MSRRVIPFLCLFSVLIVVISVPRTARTTSPVTPSEPTTRSFEFTYQVHFPATENPAAPVRLWIPLPQSDGYQDLSNVRIESTVAYAKGRDPEYKDAFTEFKPTAKQAASGFGVTLRFAATRHEHKVALARAVKDVSASLPADPMLHRYLESDRLVPLSGVIGELAKEHTAGDTTQLEKARHIYDYVVATMRYDKSGEGWGRGDAVWACTSKRGNCTDFHSLFIGMMRASGIPARFEIGFPLPEDKTAGDIPGYHCWAEFYLSGVGWIPIDASEAWKHPEKRDYFFGAHDVNRVFFTYGRDIRLSSDQKGAPLNYFIYPYAEVNGQPVKNLETHFSFRDLATTEQAAGR